MTLGNHLPVAYQRARMDEKSLLIEINRRADRPSEGVSWARAMLFEPRGF